MPTANKGYKKPCAVAKQTTRAWESEATELEIEWVNMNKDYDGRFKRRTFNSWKRGWEESRPGSYRTTMNSFTSKFKSLIYANMDVSVDAKRAALKVAPSVVSLISFTGDQPFFWGSGTIIDSEDVNGVHTSTIFTSASLLRFSKQANNVPDDIKIHVYLSNGNCKVGQVYMINFHYNVAAIKIESDAPLPPATLRFTDDSISINPNESSSSRAWESDLRSNSDTFNLCPGEMVVAVGRYHEEPYDVMAAPGTFSFDACELDCAELLKADCLITKCGIGGPLVNRYGEVIGVNFYDSEYTPFLPINIASKCLEHFKKHGKSCQPWLGMVMSNLCATSLEMSEQIIQKFPDTHNGIIVEEVLPNSPAERAGILSDDVIIECNGEAVQSLLELWRIISDDTEKPVELVLIRTISCDDASKLKIVVGVGAPDKINSWPVAESCRMHTPRYRY